MFDWQIPSTTPFLAVIVTMLALIALFLRRFGDQLISYYLAWILYMIVSVAASLYLQVRGTGFDILRLLSWAVFPGGFVLLAISAYFARRHFPVSSRIFCFMMVCFVAIGIDAFLIEPRMLEVNRIKIASSKLQKPVRIGILSDLQTDKVTDFERQALQALLDESPDLILLPGDYIQTNAANDWPERMRQVKNLNLLLKELKLSAPLGVYAVRGNTEADDWTETFAGLPVTTFEQTGSVKVGDMVLTGLSFRDSFDPTYNIVPAEAFHLVFGHGPDFALGKTNADVLVAGHTHGGQVQLPFIGPLITLSRVPHQWAEGGLTKLDKDTFLVLTRGVGMERHYAPRLRFLCRPEIVILELVPKPGTSGE